MNQNRASSPVRQSAAGFTLIEIMVVVLIIGLLAALVGPNVSAIFGDSQVQKAETDVRSIADTVDYYRMKNGKLPESLEVLTEKTDKRDALLTELSKDPWGNDYQLVVTSPKEWLVLSWGPNGSEGDDDDISAGPAKVKEK